MSTTAKKIIKSVATALSIVFVFAIIIILVGICLTVVAKGKLGMGILSTALGAGLLSGMIFSGMVIFGGILFINLMPRFLWIGKIITYVGVISIMVFLFIIEVQLIATAGAGIAQQNANAWTDCKSPTGGSIMQAASCIVTGYMPASYVKMDVVGFISLYGFYIFGLLIPLVIFGALFSDFVESSGVIQNATYQKVIGWGLGFMAYRGFLVSKLIFILDIGGVGIGMILLNFIFLSGIFSKVKKMLDKYKPIEVAKNTSEIVNDAKSLALDYLKNCKLLPEREIRNMFFNQRFMGFLREALHDDGTFDYYKAKIDTCSDRASLLNAIGEIEKEIGKK